MRDSSGFPISKKTSFTSHEGINFVKRIIMNDYNWNFIHTNQQDDYGIDATVEIVDSDRFITGHKVLLQIKSGESYFKNSTESHYVFYGDNKHINYYLNSQIPVLLIICNEVGDCYWEVISPQTMEPTKKRWKLEVPKEQKLNVSSKSEILKLLPEVKNFIPNLESKYQLYSKSIESLIKFVESGSYFFLREGLTRNILLIKLVLILIMTLLLLQA